MSWKKVVKSRLVVTTTLITFLFVVAVVILVRNRLEEIYLLSGGPFPWDLNVEKPSVSPIELYKIIDGEMKLVREVAPYATEQFIQPYPDQRVVIVFTSPEPGELEFDILNMNRPNEVNEIALTTCEQCSIANPSWGGLVVEEDEELRLNLIQFDLSELSRLPPGSFLTPIESAYEIVTGKEVEIDSQNSFKFIHSYGLPGTLVTHNGQLNTLRYRDGQVLLGDQERGFGWDIGWTIPKDYFNSSDYVDTPYGELAYLVQVINNDSMRAVFKPRRNYGAEHDALVKVFNKSTGVWADLDTESDFYGLRGFFEWVAGEPIFLVDNAGSSFGPLWDYSKVEDRNKNYKILYAARLEKRGGFFLYNSSDGRHITHNTAVGDTEVLWVEDEEVYFRVEDELRKGQIRGESVEEIELVAKSESLIDVHWMFK